MLRSVNFTCKNKENPSVFISSSITFSGAYHTKIWKTHICFKNLKHVGLCLFYIAEWKIPQIDWGTLECDKWMLFWVHKTLRTIYPMALWDCGPEYYFLKAPFLGITIELFTHVSNHWPDAKSEAFKSQLTFLLLDEDAVKHKILSKNMQIILQNNWEGGKGELLLNMQKFSAWDDKKKFWKWTVVMMVHLILLKW